MKNILITFTLSALFCLTAWSQKKTDFNITAHAKKTENNLYNSLEYIESRPDTQDLGLVYTGAWNGVQPITLPTPIDTQLKTIFGNTSNDGNDKKIAVQMRKLYFGIGTEDQNKRKGICSIRMTLYEMDGENNYYFLNTLDTLLVTKDKEIIAAAGNMITSFISDNLPYFADEGEEALDIDQVMDIDVYEMASIPFYNTEVIPDGIYKTYRSLMQLTPDDTSPASIKNADEIKIKEIQIPDPQKPGKFKKIKEKEVYAVVIQGIPCISFNGDFYSAYRNNGMWCFRISQKVAGSGFSLGISVGGGSGYAGGGTGIGIPLGGKKEIVEMIIDHLNGEIYWGDRIIPEENKE